ncbi:MAG: hypothetical protein H0S84_14130 [Bacteroidales bacterium]|nr:hypothetical protein [Bacteroidales bacterium]
MMKNGVFVRKILRYFFQGLLYLAPVTITIWSIYLIFQWVDGLLINYLDELLSVHIPGLGILVLLILITLIGMLGSTILFKPFIAFFDQP